MTVEWIVYGLIIVLSVLVLSLNLFMVWDPKGVYRGNWFQRLYTITLITAFLVAVGYVIMIGVSR